MQGLARWSLLHRRTVVVCWSVLLVFSVGAAHGLKNQFVNNLTLPGTDAQRATDLLKSSFPALAGDSDHIVFHSRTGSLANPMIRDRVTTTLRLVSRLPHVTRVDSPYADPRAISRDGAIGFATVSFDERGDALPSSAVERVIATAERARSAALDVELGGSAIETTQRPTLGAATLIGIGAAMIVLFLSFGSLPAASLPILTALFGLGSSTGLIAALTHVLNTPDFASELAILIGLGVGVDYALFVVTRYREALVENGGDVDAAVIVAMSTAGRSVAFAGAIVVIAVLGLFVVGVDLFYGVALATSLAVLLVLLASLTLLPALLSLVGRRLAGRRRQRKDTVSAVGGWTQWLGLIQRRPAPAALAAVALLLVLATPALALRLAASDASNDLKSTTTRQAYDLLSRGFGAGFNAPLTLAVRTPATGSRAALGRLASAVEATPGVASVSDPILSPAGHAAAVIVYPTSSPQSTQTYDLVERLRGETIPPIVAATGATVLVGGFTASQVDFAHVISSKLPLFIAVVIGLSAILLLLVFRSLLIPLQAAVMNLLSIGAALGVVQAVFERGWGAGLIGVSRSPIEAFIPVIVFAIVFGLSMDYEVFLVSRIHEVWTRHGDHAHAVREGLTRTSRVITAAAAVMVVVFSSFAASDNHILKLFGLALATAVFLDAVVIRTVLLPATLQLLGRRTWTLPRWADRLLPRLSIEAPHDTSEPLRDVA